MGRWNKRVKEARKEQSKRNAPTDDNPPTENVSKRRPIVYLIIAFVIITAFPFIILYSSGYHTWVNFPEAVAKSFSQLFSWIQIFSIGFLILAIILTSISAAFLFEIKLEKVVSDRWYWKILKRFDLENKRKVWHLFIGYFIAISALTPIIGTDIYRAQEGIGLFDEYQSHLVALMIIPIALLLGRIASKFDIEIIDTNLGFFIVVLFLGLLMFAIMASGASPFLHYMGMAGYTGLSDKEPGSTAAGGFALYMSTLIETGVVTLFDFGIMYKLKKPL